MNARVGMQWILVTVLLTLVAIPRALAGTVPDCSLVAGVQKQLCQAYLLINTPNTHYAGSVTGTGSSAQIDPANPRHTTYWIIDPPLNVPVYTDGGIPLYAGDTVVVAAQGCANHGGNSDTWLSVTDYEAPAGQFLGPSVIPGTPYNHYWGFFVPNGTPAGNPSLDPSGSGAPFYTIANPVPTPITVQGSGYQFQGYFSIGFKDDSGGYSDNGYYAWYPGRNQECLGWYGVWFQVDVTHSNAWGAGGGHAVVGLGSPGVSSGNNPPPPPPPPQPLFANAAFRTINGHFLTAVGGGGLGGANTSLQTDRTQAAGWETFLLVWTNPGQRQFALKTSNGEFVTAVNGGGVGGPNNILAPLHTDAPSVGPWEKFNVNGPVTCANQSQTMDAIAHPGSLCVTIQTANGHYVTAQGGGGIGGSALVLHTDATQLGSWEQFQLMTP